MRAGAIPPLLDLLECGVFEVAEQAVWAIGNIAGDNDDYRKMILELDGFSRIIEFATKNQGIKSAVRNCVWCLSNLCRNQQRVEGMFCHIRPHLEFLSQLMRYNDEEIVADVCWAFSFLTESSNEQKKEIIPSVDPPLLMALICTKNPRIQCPALRIAGNIISGEDNNDTQKMIDAGLVPILVALMKSATDTRKKEILWIISNITAGSTSQINVVISYGFIPYLVGIVSWKDNPILFNDALFALCNAINGGNAEQVRPWRVVNHRFGTLRRST